MDGYYVVGEIRGTNTVVDIDNTLPGLEEGVLIFDAVKIVDIPDLDCSTTINPGADIDAVCALQSISMDCAGGLGGNSGPYYGNILKL